MTKKILAIALASCMVASAGACTVKKTEDGQMPKVEGGKLPEYDVNTPKVEVKQDTHMVVTPSVKVTPADTTHR